MRTTHTRTIGGCVAVLAVALLAIVGLIVVQRPDGRDGAHRATEPTATSSSSPSSSPSSPPSSSPTPPGTLRVSGSGVAGQRFGADAAAATAAVAARLGEPDLTAAPERYTRLPGTDRWAQDASDPISPSWRYPVASAACWSGLCLVFGGADTDALALRGWVLTDRRPGPDVRLAGSGIRLGDPWSRLHAAYPGTSAGGGEGAAMVVDDLPWRGIFDGVGAWRLSGTWDYRHPHRAPADAVVTRLSAGEGPELGCC